MKSGSSPPLVKYSSLSPLKFSTITFLPSPPGICSGRSTPSSSSKLLYGFIFPLPMLFKNGFLIFIVLFGYEDGAAAWFSSFCRIVPRYIGLLGVFLWSYSLVNCAASLTNDRFSSSFCRMSSSSISGIICAIVLLCCSRK